MVRFLPKKYVSCTVLSQNNTDVVSLGIDVQNRRKLRLEFMKS